MSESSETSTLDETPMVTINLADSFDPDDTWEVPKSNLIKYSGFFRRMFNHEWVETRDNWVNIHDSGTEEVTHLMAWFNEGKVLDLEEVVMQFLGDRESDELHSMALGIFELLDKYDCPDFKPGCLELTAKYAKSCLNEYNGWDEPWNAEEFMSCHYEVLKRMNGGSYPAELHSFFAEVWWYFSWRDESLPKLDAAIESDHALSVAVAKSYRAKLLAQKKSMEAFHGPNFD